MHLRLPLLLTIACTAPPVEPPVVTDTTDTTPVVTTPEPTVPPAGECGDVSTWDLVVTGAVKDALGRPGVGVKVWLEDRAWVPGTVLGETYSDADGRFLFDTPGITSVEDCWATLLDYVLVGERGTEYGEVEANSELFAAINSTNLVADFQQIPLELEDSAP